MPSICVVDGTLIDPVTWDSDSRIDIKWIAHALSMKCRFTGHTPFFYSVAQHSVLVARRAIQLARKYEEESMTMQLVSDSALIQAALLHDAAEAFMGDVARPWLKMDCMAPYREMEAALTKRILSNFGLRSTLPLLVTQADNDLLAAEFDSFWPDKWKEWPHVPVSDYRLDIDSWAPVIARDKFLRLFKSPTQETLEGR